MKAFFFGSLRLPLPIFNYLDDSCSAISFWAHLVVVQWDLPEDEIKGKSFLSWDDCNVNLVPPQAACSAQCH